VLGFLERLERPYSILIGAVDAGSSAGSGDASEESSKADVLSDSSRRRSGSFIAKGFTRIISPSCDSFILRATPGSVPSMITSSSTLSFTGLGHLLGQTLPSSSKGLSIWRW
jgi:hypothetical protein